MWGKPCRRGLRAHLFNLQTLFGRASTFVVLLSYLLRVSPLSLHRICKPDDFGAAGDGYRFDTEAVSRAVDACKDGGTVQFEAGKTYRLGWIMITGRGIQLEVPKSTMLRASAERGHYGAHQDSWYLLHFYRCSECGLSGGGVIQGPAWAFVDNSSTSSKPYRIMNWGDASCRVSRQCRPRLVGVCESRDVHITDVALRDSAFWTLHIRGSERVLVRGVTVEGDMDFPNNDGIDIDGSSHVTVLQSYIATADDAVCIKATSGRWAVRHVLVSNCTLRSHSAAVKLGSETRADMSNITFSHLRVLDSNRALAILLRDHGNIRDVAFRHVQVETRFYPGNWWGGGEPIYVTALPRRLGAIVGSLINVSFEDIAADVREGVAVLAGSPESLIQGVFLQDVRVRIAPMSDAAGADATVVEAEASSPQGTAAVAVAAEARMAAEATEPGVPLAAVKVVSTEATPAGAGAPAGSSAAAGMQLCVKLDLQPGPYGSRAWLATAPLLAQFVHGLALRNVSFEFQAPAAPNCKGGFGGGGRGMEARAASRIDNMAQEMGPLVRSTHAAHLEAPTAVELRLTNAHGGVGGGDSSGEWYQELQRQTVWVAATEQVDFRVLPAPSSGPLLPQGGAVQGKSACAGRRDYWWRGLRGSPGEQLAWLVAAVVLAAAITAAAAKVCVSLLSACRSGSKTDVKHAA